MTEAAFLHPTRAEAAPRSRVQATSAARFEVLDSWRGVCALLVALHHFPASGLVSQSAFVGGTYLFVDFFFVLSGFVIFSSNADRLGDMASVKRFALVRFGRVYPLHFVMLMAFAAFELLRLFLPQLRGGGADPFTEGYSIGSFFANLFLVQGLGFEDRLTWNGPSWSISTEFFTYLIFAGVVLLFGKRAWIWFVAAIVVGPIFLFFASSTYMNVTVDYGFIRCIYGFSLGALLAHFGHDRLVASRQWLAQGGGMAWTAVEVATVLAIFAFVSLTAKNNLSILAPFVFVAALYVFAHEGGLVSRLLRTGPLLTLGALSYSIYMVHPFVQSRLINVANLVERKIGAGLLGDLTFHGETAMGFGPADPVIGSIAVGLMVAATLVASWLTWKLVEMPGLVFFRALSKRIR